MTRQKRAAFGCLGAALALVFLSAVPAGAQWTSPQTTVTSNDIQRLQDQVYQAGADVTRLRGRDNDLAVRLQSDLDDLRDEVVYLKVRMRREGNVPQREYTEIRDRLQDVRSRARGEETWRPGTTTNSGGVGGVSGGTYDPYNRNNDRTTRNEPQTTTRNGSTAIPAGTELDVRLQDELSSSTAQVEQRFEATTVTDLYRGNNEVLIPAGSVLRGVVSSVDKATRTDRKGSLTVAFDRVTVRGRDYPMRGTVTQAIESEGIKGEVGRIGTGGAVGAILGGILGGVKGALLGVLIGSGGVIAATEGKDVTLPQGTILRVRLDQPPAVR